LADFLNKNAMPLLGDVSREDSSYWYLEAHSCAKIEVGSVPLDHVFRLTYSGVLARGFEREQLEKHLPEGKKNALDRLLRPAIHDPSKLQFNCINREHFHQAAADCDLSKQELDNVYNLLDNSVGGEEQIASLLEPLLPEIQRLFDLWKNTPYTNWR
jgi:hypothetical protein